jgi:hypothetical protein
MEYLDNLFDNIIDLKTSLKADITDVIDEVYSKYHKLVNMSYSELKAWSETDCSKKASLNRGPIERNLNLLSKKKADWGATEVKSANRSISFISRMKNMEQGEPVSKNCPSKRDISLKNWGYNPNK